MIRQEKYREWARKHGFGINEEYASGIFEGLNEKKKTYDIAYCPCATVNSHSKDTVCPCKNLRENKECHCELFKQEVQICMHYMSADI